MRTLMIFRCRNYRTMVRSTLGSTENNIYWGQFTAPGSVRQILLGVKADGERDVIGPCRGRVGVHSPMAAGIGSGGRVAPDNDFLFL